MISPHPWLRIGSGGRWRAGLLEGNGRRTQMEEYKAAWMGGSDQDHVRTADERELCGVDVEVPEICKPELRDQDLFPTLQKKRRIGGVRSRRYMILARPT